MRNVAVLSPAAVQQAVDQAAHFNLYALPDPDVPTGAIIGSGGSVVGMHVDQMLHRFSVICRPPTSRTPLAARNLVGELVARLTQRWMILPDAAAAAMDRDPQPTALDTSRSQRFVMLDTQCTFANGEDGFRGFGTGLTLPVSVGRPPELLAMAVGTITQGFGRFERHEEGTYIYCGRLSPQGAFTGTFRELEDLRAIDVRGEGEGDITYLLFRGQAVPSDSVTPRLGADGRPNGLIVEQGLRLLELDAVGRERPLSIDRVGPAIGHITANVTFNPASPGGSVRDPIPFTAYDEFVFHDSESGQRIGSFTADSLEGRVFRTQILGQPGIRFGGIGRIHGGDGVFAGITGLMTDNSVVMFEPHVSASLYLLRVDDPDGRFSSRVDPEQRRPFRWDGR